jgi:ubiquinone/menaquinone biosynthesis C-methylase UbiE
MNHNDHVNLLRPSNLSPGGTYADFGAGDGAFTLALRELVGPEATIYAVDRDGAALRSLKKSHHARFGSTLRHAQGGAQDLILLEGDFAASLDLPPLDGIVMANSLHFFKDRGKILRHVRAFLKPNGVLLLVEYNVDTGNFWVPHPLTFETFSSLARQAGYIEPRLLGKIPSRFLSEFYSAAARRGEK